MNQTILSHSFLAIVLTVAAIAIASVITVSDGANADGANADDTGFKPAPVIPLTSQPQAHLIVDEPLPEALARGYVVVRYRAENLRIMPVYGPSALGILPRIGHLHVTIDDLPWHWLDASGEPLSINGLSPGPHKVLIELEDPTHKLIDSKTVSFEIPRRPAACP
jgi:hypothetical protein